MNNPVRKEEVKVKKLLFDVNNSILIFSITTAVVSIVLVLAAARTFPFI